MSPLTKNISIIGSGPSGLYTAYHLVKKAQSVNISINIKIWEKFPVPFGLSRFGVAPDHPEVKNCEVTFTSMFQNYKELSNGFCKDIQFIGNTKVEGINNTITSKQNSFPLQNLIESEDAVVFSYGCNGDRKLNIENEDNTKGVFSSRQFVNWYNGQFDMALSPEFMNFNWSQVKKVGIIGNGNVALDITRILISNQIDQIWSPTDISNEAISKLKTAPIEDIKIFGRRDFLQSKFTNKELRELWELEQFGIFGSINSKQFNEIIDDSWKETNFNRPTTRRLEMCKEYMLPFDQRSKKNYKKVEPPISRQQSKKHWEFDYLKSPIRINKDPLTNIIKSLTVCDNVMDSENKLVQKSGQDNEHTYDIDLLITSLGYKGESLEVFDKLNIKFNRDHIANDKGRVLTNEGKIFERLYASGWIRNGSQGVIANTMQDSFQVADEILKDLPSLPIRNKGKTTYALPSNHTNWSDWEKINKQEIANGIPYGKQRQKYLAVNDILHQLNKL